MKAVAALSLLAVLASSTAARAQGTDEFGAYGGLEHAKRQESPQSWAFEIRLGPYPPSIDDEFSNATPFADTFGDSTRFLVGVEFDAQLIRIPHFGSFGPGFGWGYTAMSADARIASDPTQRGDQETSLSIMPLYAVGVLRVDVLAHDVGVPLVPYAKLGLGYAHWWASDEVDAGGSGHSYGYQYALGGMLLLDFFDEGAAVEIDTTSGVNNSYFFVEWYVSQLDGFGAGDMMQVGTNTWMAGIALEI